MESKLQQLSSLFNVESFRTLHEELGFEEYLDRVCLNPRLARTAYQRLYDMIMEKGTHQFERYRKTYTHYNFFDNELIPIYGLDDTLENLVTFIRGAAGGYGTEKRVLLLHGPVGSSKSTICRLLKRGMELYSHTDDGAWYSFKWVNLPTGSDGIFTQEENHCPMHEDPLKLIPVELREKVVQELNETLMEQTPEDDRATMYSLRLEGELDPRCKKFMDELMDRNNGDWGEVCRKHIRVVRKVYSEADRCGVATFQPKDEKNQDSTELTGDINYAQLPHYGSDSDPRAFNFDGEFCVGNRGIVEFIEVLKLAKEFLYDLLGASQEQQIKPKKFSQIFVDTVLIGHSIHGDTPIPCEYEGVLDVLPISKMDELEFGKLRVFSVNLETNQVELTSVRNIFSHEFEGDWVKNKQSGDVLTTTPNHSVYKWDDGNLETFYPGDDEQSEIAVFDLPMDITSNHSTTERWDKFFGIGEKVPEYVKK